MRNSVFFLILVVLFISCSTNSDSNDNQNSQVTPIEVLQPITKPTGVKISENDYELKIQWDTIKYPGIKGFNIYRDTITNPTKLYFTTQNKCVFTDKFVLIHKKYFYRVTTLGSNGTETDKSLEVNGIPKEPINNNIPRNGEIGGVFYVNWDFQKERFREIVHQFTIYNEPTNKNGSLNKDGIYFQLNDSDINGIGCYYGIQTKTGSPKKGDVGKGAIFSRWGTRDTLNYKTSPGGFGESAGYEGDFISVRKAYKWKAGRYEAKLRLDSTDLIGDWYGFYITKLSSNVTEYIGSIRFERKSPTNGIKNFGGTWIEIYSKESGLLPLPNWHVSVDKITADGIDAKKAYIQYNSDRFLEFSNIFTSNGKNAHFLMGPNVKRVNKHKTYLW
jgi:hypothetical protein